MNGAVLGAAIGLCLYGAVVLLWRGIQPKKSSLADLLESASKPIAVRSLTQRERILDVLVTDARKDSGIKADLAALNRSPGEFAVTRLATMLLFASLPVVLALLTGLTGSFSWNPVIVLILAGGGAVGGFGTSRALLASAATERRQMFETEFAGFLDIVSLLLAGGAGIDEALQVASRAGDAPGILALRDAVNSAIGRNVPVWDALEELSLRARLDPVTELVSSIRLAGGRGAQVRSSLVAKAEGLRSSQASAELAASERASEKMGVPIVFMFLIFMVLTTAPLASKIFTE